MSVWAIANNETELERQAAAWGVQDLQRGRTDAANYFFELAAKHRATGYEFQATGAALEELHAARLAELRRRVEVLRTPEDVKIVT